MDELTRERFWPLPKPAPVYGDESEWVEERRRILLGDDGRTRQAEEAQRARLRLVRLKRDQKLIAAIRSAA
jgi:hypothetical protein